MIITHALAFNEPNPEYNSPIILVKSLELSSGEVPISSLYRGILPYPVSVVLPYRETESSPTEIRPDLMAAMP